MMQCCHLETAIAISILNFNFVFTVLDSVVMEQTLQRFVHCVVDIACFNFVLTLTVLDSVVTTHGANPLEADRLAPSLFV